MRKLFLIGLLMAIFIQQAGVNRRGRPTFVVTANRYWELKAAASMYATRIHKDRRGHYFLAVTEWARVRGISYESAVPSPRQRSDPRNFRPDKLGGSQGDSRWAPGSVAEFLNANAPGQYNLSPGVNIFAGQFQEPKITGSSNDSVKVSPPTYPTTTSSI